MDVTVFVAKAALSSSRSKRSEQLPIISDNQLVEKWSKMERRKQGGGGGIDR